MEKVEEELLELLNALQDRIMKVYFLTDESWEGCSEDVTAYGLISEKEANSIEDSMNKYSPYDYAVACRFYDEVTYKTAIQARVNSGCKVIYAR